MIIAISSTGENLNDPMDSRFGRTKFFIFYNNSTGTHQALANTQNLQAVQGAGIQSAVRVAENDAQVVLTGHCGPKAFRVLQEAGIKVYLCSAGTPAEAIEQFEAGKLTEAQQADVEGHWA